MALSKMTTANARASAIIAPMLCAMMIMPCVIQVTYALTELAVTLLAMRTVL